MKPEAVMPIPISNTRAGGNAQLFDQMLNGMNIPGAGVVNGTTISGSAALRAYFTARADDYGPAFIRHDRARGKARGRGANYRLSPLSVWKTVKKIGRLAEVPISTHDFRHAKATVLLNQGAKLSEVQDILGHASPETTKKIYAHYEVQHLRDAFERYSLSAEEMEERARRRTATKELA